MDRHFIDGAVFVDILEVRGGMLVRGLLEAREWHV